MIWWAMIVSNLVLALLLTLMMNRVGPGERKNSLNATTSTAQQYYELIRLGEFFYPSTSILKALKMLIANSIS